MNDIERRALLGDRQAQEECTRKGIALPCPQCFCAMQEKGEYFLHPKSWCGFSFPYSEDEFVVSKKCLSDWNTRLAPPIGRCKDCANWNEHDNAGKENLGNFVCACEEWSDPENGYTRYTGAGDFCSNFEPKGGEENG